MNFRVSGQNINTTTSVKCLDVYLNDFFTLETHFKNLIPKLNWAIGLLSKVRHCTPKFILKTIYCSFFKSHLIYASQIWEQIKTKLLQEVVKLQNKATRIINFLPFNSSNINKTNNDHKILIWVCIRICRSLYLHELRNFCRITYIMLSENICFWLTDWASIYYDQDCRLIQKCRIEWCC